MAMGSAGRRAPDLNPAGPATRALRLLVLVVATGAFASIGAGSTGASARQVAGQQATRPCRATQLRASVASDVGASGEGDVMVEMDNMAPTACVLEGTQTE